MSAIPFFYLQLTAPKLPDRFCWKSI